ncbi:MAG: PqqD family protein [Bacteroidales bacterium]|nr:PqqD family protein [Bacteroidales bacterium]
MKIKEGFILRKICGQNVLSGEGSQNVNFAKLVSLNETAAFLFEKLREAPSIDAETMAALLEGEYEVDHETALKDSQTLLDQWVEIGVVI